MMMRWISLMVTALLRAQREVQDPAYSKELNTEDYVGLLREDVQVKR